MVAFKLLSANPKMMAEKIYFSPIDLALDANIQVNFS